MFLKRDCSFGNIPAILSKGTFSKVKYNNDSVFSLILNDIWLADGSGTSTNSLCKGLTDVSLKYRIKTEQDVSFKFSLVHFGPLQPILNIPQSSSSAGYSTFLLIVSLNGGTGVCHGRTNVSFKGFDKIFSSNGAIARLISSILIWPAMIQVKFSGR